MQKREFVWTHETAHFLVALHIEPEDADPADSFEFEEDIEAVRSGAVEWFSASVEVYGPHGELLGRDTLGGCAYETVREFYTSHWASPAESRNTMAQKAQNCVIGHYFPDMVRNAIQEARSHICAIPRVRCV